MNTFNGKHEYYKGILDGLTLMSDMFMRNVLQDQRCTEYILQVIMDKSDLQIIDQTIQKDYKNLQGRSAILDCVAKDSAGRYMNIEIQQKNDGASPKRARYHSGLLDMNILKSGQDFDVLPETYVIFITQEDILKGGLPIYHISRQIGETGELFQDDAYIIYVNAAKEGDTELGRLMHDFHCTDAKDIHSSVLADRVRLLKETEKGANSMCELLERMCTDVREETQKEMALSMAETGMDAEQIANIAKVNVSVVLGWISEEKK